MKRQQPKFDNFDTAAAKEIDAPEPIEQFAILLVDDSAVSLRGMARMLRKNWDVDLATSSDDAIKMMAQTNYAVVVSDCDMPGHNGIWLLEQVRETSPGTIRVLTSAGLHERFAPYLKSGLIHVFLHKPLVGESLSNMLIGLIMR